MARFQLSGAMLVATLALCAITASAALAATEGPFYRIGGNRLLEGESTQIKATLKAGAHFSLEAKAVGIKITCTGLKLNAGATITGSTGANAGQSKQTIEYSGCTVEGNGAGCTLGSERITTNPVVSTLGYSNASRTGTLLVLFEPESGTTFTTLNFSGACTFPTTKIQGNTVGEVLSGGSAVQVGSEVEATKGEVAFNNKAKTIFVESAGKLRTVKGKLESFGLSATLEGAPVLELAAKPTWGVFT